MPMIEVTTSEKINKEIADKIKKLSSAREG